MGSGTGIEWTEVTWNPTTGCDRISAGCDHCYALSLAKRLKAMGQAKYQADGDPRTSGPGFGLTVHPDALRLPYTWAGHRTVFVNSMSDLFHVRVPLSFVRDVFEVIAATPQHTYQLLTKRSKRLARIKNFYFLRETRCELRENPCPLDYFVPNRTTQQDWRPSHPTTAPPARRERARSPSRATRPGARG